MADRTGPDFGVTQGRKRSWKEMDDANGEETTEENIASAYPAKRSSSRSFCENSGAPDVTSATDVVMHSPGQREVNVNGAKGSLGAAQREVAHNPMSLEIPKSHRTSWIPRKSSLNISTIPIDLESSACSTPLTNERCTNDNSDNDRKLSEMGPPRPKPDQMGPPQTQPPPRPMTPNNGSIKPSGDSARFHPNWELPHEKERRLHREKVLPQVMIRSGRLLSTMKVRNVVPHKVPLPTLDPASPADFNQTVRYHLAGGDARELLDFHASQPYGKASKSDLLHLEFIDDRASPLSWPPVLYGVPSGWHGASVTALEVDVPVFTGSNDTQRWIAFKIEVPLTTTLPGWGGTPYPPTLHPDFTDSNPRSWVFFAAPVDKVVIKNPHPPRDKPCHWVNPDGTSNTLKSKEIEFVFSKDGPPAFAFSNKTEIMGRFWTDEASPLKHLGFADDPKVTCSSPWRPNFLSADNLLPYHAATDDMGPYIPQPRPNQRMQAQQQHFQFRRRIAPLPPPPNWHRHPPAQQQQQQHVPRLMGPPPRPPNRTELTMHTLAVHPQLQHQIHQIANRHPGPQLLHNQRVPRRVAPLPNLHEAYRYAQGMPVPMGPFPHTHAHPHPALQQAARIAAAWDDTPPPPPKKPKHPIMHEQFHAFPPTHPYYSYVHSRWWNAFEQAAWNNIEVWQRIRESMSQQCCRVRVRYVPRQEKEGEGVTVFGMKALEPEFWERVGTVPV